jgi:hypothetical protein
VKDQKKFNTPEAFTVVEKRKKKMIVIAHLVDIDWPEKPIENPCCEISLKRNTAVLMEPKQITKLRLLGTSVYDHTEERQLELNFVEQSKCYYPPSVIRSSHEKVGS